MTDRLLRGQFPRHAVRFAVCQTSSLCSEAARRHQADWIAGWLLSEALTCAALLSIDLKHTEKITLRWMYAGPVGDILADTTEDARVRGYTQRVRLLGEAGTLAEAVGTQGQVVAITSLPTKVVHTGVTQAVFQDVAHDMAHLLSLSFQVESAMTVGLIMPPDEPLHLRSAVGVLLQPMPDADLEIFESMRQQVERPDFRAWLEAEPRPLEAVLERVAGGAMYEVLGSAEPAFACSCTRPKVERVLRMLDPAELQDMLEKDGYVEVRCHFCAEAYHFGENEVHALLRQSASGHA